jgi:hypothetical protein
VGHVALLEGEQNCFDHSEIEGGFRDIEIETRVATRMFCEKMPVQPDLAVAENAAKFQLQDFALVGFGDKKCLRYQATSTGK